MTQYIRSRRTDNAKPNLPSSTYGKDTTETTFRQEEHLNKVMK